LEKKITARDIISEHIRTITSKDGEITLKVVDIRDFYQVLKQKLEITEKNQSLNSFLCLSSIYPDLFLVDKISSLIEMKNVETDVPVLPNKRNSAPSNKYTLKESKSIKKSKS
jgi:hypothetical protein